MRKILLALVPAAGLLAAPTIAAAVDRPTSGAVGGAASGAIGGAIIGGPVGAAAGLVIGAVVGAAVNPPPPVVTEYVASAEDAPPVYMEGNLVVGAQLPRQVTLYPVPEDPDYAYAFINGHRVVVDARTYVVVEVVS